MLPKLFIGSSSEALNIAYAVQENLERDADVFVWTQGIFELSSTTLNDLEKGLKNYDFAILIFTPDDIIFSRSQQSPVARDNVIFELGLFVGYLGSNRTYILKPQSVAIKLPSDLLGITPGTYNPSNTNLQAATGPFCNKVRMMMKKYYGESLPLYSKQTVVENIVRYDLKVLNDAGDMQFVKTISLTPLKHAISYQPHEGIL